MLGSTPLTFSSLIQKPSSVIHNIAFPPNKVFGISNDGIKNIGLACVPRRKPMASKHSAKRKSFGTNDVENKVRSQYTKMDVQLSRTQLFRAQNSRIVRSHSHRTLQQELSVGKREALRRISKFLANEILNSVSRKIHKTLQQSRSSKVVPGTPRIRMGVEA